MGGDQGDELALDSGAVYVFTRSGTTWSQQAYLKASNTTAGDLFGFSVSLSSDTLAAGALGQGVNNGAVYVFTRSVDTWSQQAFLKGSDTVMPDNFGASVSLFGDTLAVGAQNEGIADNVQGHGAAYVFTRSDTTWSQQAALTRTTDNSMINIFGTSISLSDGALAVGDPFDRSNATGVNGNEVADDGAPVSGAVYVFPFPSTAL